MKKLVCICALVLLCVLSAGAKDKHQVFNQLCKVAKEVDKIEGVETFKISGLLMTAVKAAAKSEMKKEAKKEKSSKEDDEDLEMSAEMLKNLSAMLMVDFSDASEADKAEIVRRFDAVLADSTDLIMEADDEGERTRMYGRVDEQNGTVEDMVLYSPTDGTLMALCGKLELAEAMNMAND